MIRPAHWDPILELVGVAIWLKAPLNVLVELHQPPQYPPLVGQGNPEEILRDLLEKRTPAYSHNAQITLHSGMGRW